MSIPAWCDDAAKRGFVLDRIQVQRAINGETGSRVTVDFAHKVAEATGGVVPMTAWRSETQVLEQAEPEPSPKAKRRASRAA
jgi:hypothetical protein